MTYPDPIFSTAQPTLQPPAVQRLVGRRILISGADSAIAREVAVSMAHEGASIALTYESQCEDEGRLTAEAVARSGALAFERIGDPSEQAFADLVVASAVEALGGLDVLIVIPRELTASDRLAGRPIDQALARTIYPLFRLSTAAQPYLSAGGSIISTDSVSNSGSAMSVREAQAGVETVTRSLARKFADARVRVNGVAPLSGKPVAAAYVYLASNASTQVTGEMLVV